MKKKLEQNVKTKNPIKKMNRNQFSLNAPHSTLNICIKICYLFNAHGVNTNVSDLVQLSSQTNINGQNMFELYLIHKLTQSNIDKVNLDQLIYELNMLRINPSFLT